MQSTLRLHALTLIPLASLLLSGCLFSSKDKDPDGETDPAGRAEAHLTLRTAALAGSSALATGIDSVFIQVTGEGMDAMSFSFSGESMALSLGGLPPGDGRQVSASLFKRGKLLYLGQSTCDLRKEKRVDLTLRCDPQFSRVKARFHVPLSLPVAVVDGWLKLSGASGASGEFQARMERQGEFVSFLVDEVPGNVKYDVSLTLLDGAAKTVYESQRSGVLLPLGQEVQWDLPLIPTQATAGLNIELPVPREVQVFAAFPAARRKPARAGEAVVTEFYAAPSTRDSSTEGEWWELFNRTADTLVLSGCRLARSRSTSASLSLPLDSTHVLPPGQAKVFGRAAAKADYHYGDFTLVNTSSPLVLLCNMDSVVVDSLRYSATADDSTAVTIKEGQVSSADASHLANRAPKDAWCLTKPPEPGLGASIGYATPGWVGDCAK